MEVHGDKFASLPDLSLCPNEYPPTSIYDSMYARLLSSCDRRTERDERVWKIGVDPPKPLEPARSTEKYVISSRQ